MLVFAITVLNWTAAFGHGTSSGLRAPGVQIPSLTHGQMAVIARYRSDILALASEQTETDLTFRRLVNYGNIQYTYCLWGVVPGSTSDEQSPFNECSHAYLSATKAILEHMKTMPGSKQAAQQLISEIDADMVLSGASWVLCQFSGEQFSTGKVIEPQWRGVLFHWPSFLTFSGATVVAFGGVFVLFKPRRGW
ncbi:MAG: hypothetical protein J0I79_03455 [Mesorhizobium sp.]|uniref:hypothetical protein n=1 Tax=Mesorhizobium sp. TaxID=1871066 RepID=UPI001AC973C0|nr:hypothetical protein [Mesorhizobium sp.]MBN9216990.1 hypothetical protein [Mesorhizobium sp.]